MSGEIPLHGIPTKHDAEIYSRRLISSCDTLRHIDVGDFPCTEYSAGEKRPIFDKKTGKQIGEELVLLPLSVLRKGVARAIEADLQMFTEWGARDQALQIIESRKPK